MKAPNGPLILIIFCGIIFAVCWFVITAITTPTRAITSGIALAAFAALFIWFASTDRFAIARGIIAFGATALAAPLAAVQAVTNEAIFSLLESPGPTDTQFRELDDLFALGWNIAAIGGATALVLLIVGGVMHRPAQN